MYVTGRDTLSSPVNSSIRNYLRITEHPTDQFLPADQSQGHGPPVTLNCKASGGDFSPDSPPPTIAWYRSGGLPVVTATDDVSSHRMQLPNGQLLLTRVQIGRRRTDEGSSLLRRDNDDEEGDEVEEDGILVDDDEQTDLGEYYCTATDPRSGVSVVSRKAIIDFAGQC